MKDFAHIQWETQTAEQAAQLLGVDSSGLNQAQVTERQEAFGLNKLPEVKRDPLIKRFLMQFHNALIYVLLAAAFITALKDHWIDTWVILAVVVINAIVGFVQEDKAQKALDSVKNLLSLKASVIRDGVRAEVPAETLVPGDVVVLEAGSKIPADIRLISVSHFEVEEASLTGESLAVTKKTGPVDEGTVLGERSCMAYAGTTVRTGSARGIVVATATDTELGKINTLLTETKAMDTPLIRKMNQLGKQLSVAILGFSALLAAYSVLIMGSDITETFTAVVGLAVAAIPEGLPAVITITLAIGVRRMAGRNALVRQLPSVETLGSVTVICSDKTGTLTKNEMTATSVHTAANTYEVTGRGYAPFGEITSVNNAKPAHDVAFARLIEAADLCNEADVTQDKGTWEALGSPTEAALKALTYKAYLQNQNRSVAPDAPEDAFLDVTPLTVENAHLVADIPFDSKFKYRATLHTFTEGENAESYIFVVGASEKIVELAQYQQGIADKDPIDTAYWEEVIETSAASGQRLLGAAFKKVPSDTTRLEHADLESDMVIAGIVGIIDPPREEAIEAIATCRRAGIIVKMITGDHKLTAREIAAQMNLTDNKRVITGAELEEMDDAQLRKVAMNCDIFARTSPEHKFKLVSALQEAGEIVSMTGDGVNDAPALRKADIGVAMGIKGTEVTKEAAEMVLADDNFRSIVSAVREGRRIFGNIRKTILFIFATNGAEAMTMTIPILMGATLPITAVQILWANLVTAVTSALALANEPAEKGIMEDKPRSPKAPLIGANKIAHMTVVALLIAGAVIVLFNLFKDSHGFDYARTVAINMLIMGELFYAFNCRNMHKTVLGKGFFKNKAIFILSGILILIQIGYTYLPFMQSWFDSVPLSFTSWLLIVGIALGIFLLVEMQKIIQSWIVSRKAA